MRDRKDTLLGTKIIEERGELERTRVPFSRTLPARTLWALTLAAGVIALFLTPYCGLIFHCGCRELWEGGAKHCNINNEFSPHCPFCNHGVTGVNLVRVSIFGAEAIALAWARGRNWSWLRLAVLVPIVFLVAVTITGILFAWRDGYAIPLASSWWQYYRM